MAGEQAAVGALQMDGQTVERLSSLVRAAWLAWLNNLRSLLLHTIFKRWTRQTARQTTDDKAAAAAAAAAASRILEQTVKFCESSCDD